MIGAAIGAIAALFEDLFGGSSAPPTPRQLLYARHPLYDWILGAPFGLIVTEGSPVQLIQSIERPPPPEFHAAPSGSVSFPLCEGLFLSLTAPAVVGCWVYGSACLGGGLPACALAFATCGTEVAGLGGCYAQAHGKPFPGFGEDLPPGDLTPEAPTPPLQPQR